MLEKGKLILEFMGNEYSKTWMAAKKSFLVN